MRFVREVKHVRVGHLAAAWGVLFAIVHAYWAAGAAAGMYGDAADTLAAQVTLYFLVGGLLVTALGWLRRSAP
jgi:hypothetical protein